MSDLPATRSGRATSAFVCEASIEPLEGRQLFAVSLPKIGQVLEYLANDFSSRSISRQPRSFTRHHPFALARTQPNREVVITVNDTVLVRVVPNAKGARKLLTQLRGIGATVPGKAGVIMTAAVPISQLAKLNGLSALRYADAAAAPKTLAGRTDDFGSQAMNADRGQKQFAVDGSGVRVGILSDSYNAFNGASTGIASGDLPASGVTTVMEGPTSNATVSLEDEGRAMAEIVHDVAPGATISFYSAFYGEAAFADGIVTLAKPQAQGGQGAQVLVDDVAYPYEPYFQDGIVAQAINAVASQYGTSYFSAAGNSGRSSYESAFAATAQLNLTSGAGNGVFHDFDPGPAVNPYQPITIPAGKSVDLVFQWDSPFYSASVNAGGTTGALNSVNLYLINSDQTQSLTSAITNRTGNDAYQELTYTNSGSRPATYYLVAKARYGTPPGTIKFIDWNGVAIWGFATNSGTSVGHAVAAGGQSVGAAYYGQTPAFGSIAMKESYSSAGGTPIFFNSDGTRKPAAESRNQPAIIAPDGAATTFFRELETSNNAQDGQYHFYGTSAAAPHAAAVAALLLQANPTLTNTQLYSVLQSTALDMGATGFDYDNGFGLIQADKALALVAGGSIGGRVYRDTNSNGSYDPNDSAVSGGVVFLDSNNNGIADQSTTSFDSNGSTAISDATSAVNGLSRTTAPITSTATGRVTGLSVGVNLSHARTSDLALILVTPGGTRIPLLTTLSGVTANKGTGLAITLNDTATIPIQSASSATTLSGMYKPQSSLAAAVNETASGLWQLEVRDHKSGVAGTLNSWSLTIQSADPTTLTNAAGQYTFTGLAPSAFYGTYRVATQTQSGYSLASPADGSYLVNLAHGGVVAAKDFRFVASSTPATITNIILDDGQAQRSMVRGLTLLLNGVIPLDNIASEAFILKQSSGPIIHSYAATVTSVTSPADGQTAIRLSFVGDGMANGSLGDGRYILTIDGSKLLNAAGQATDAAGNGSPGSIKTYAFHRLSADADGNAVVDFNDFLILQNAFNSATGDPAFHPGADSDGNGVINFNDFLVLQNQFGHEV